MRKNSPRKWLHAVLDLLPLVIIPIFAIYSHRHTIDSYDVTREKYQVVNFNQQYKDSYYNGFTYSGAIGEQYASASERVYTLNITEQYTSLLQMYRYFTPYDLELTIGHKYYASVYIYSNRTFPLTFRLYPSIEGTSYSYNTPNAYSKLEFINQANNNSYPKEFGIISGGSITLNVDDFITLKDYQLVDLTLMFGEGNEPSIAEYNQMFPNDYYDYTTSKKVLVQNGTETLNNTDIGSQFVYALYTPIHDYMNFNNVFNFGKIYDWMQLNIFGGTAPLSVFIVWNIVLYEFLMDLIFLMYALFMFFIDFCTNLIDRFHCTCSGKR